MRPRVYGWKSYRLAVLSFERVADLALIREEATS
jgi:hypothetical protein